MADDKALAVFTHVEGLLPPLPELADALEVQCEKAGDLGPQINLPAVYVSIMIQAFRLERLTRQHDQMQNVINRAARKPSAPLVDDQAMALAVHLANEAMAMSFEPLEAAGALWHAAATIAVAHLPSENALSALDGMHAIVRADVAEAIGKGATRQ